MVSAIFAFVYPIVAWLALALCFVGCIVGFIVVALGPSWGVPAEWISIALWSCLALVIPLLSSVKYFLTQVEQDLKSVGFVEDPMLKTTLAPILANFNGDVVVGKYNSSDLNAIAISTIAGKKATVGFSTALLKAANPNQLQAIAAHEVAHLINRDSANKAAIRGFNKALITYPYLGATLCLEVFKSLRWWFAALFVFVVGFGLLDGGPTGLMASFWHFVVLLVQTFWPFLAVVIGFLLLMLGVNSGYSCYSRQREFEADQGGARMTSNQDMKSALSLLQTTGYPTSKVSIFDSHPPLKARLDRL